MSEEEERVAEVSLPPVKVPASLKEILDDLKYLKLRGDKLRLFTTTDIMREALLKGARLILLEREIFDRIIIEEAKKGALRIYTSLERGLVEEPQVSTSEGEALEEKNEVKEMEEVEEEEEEEEEEED